MKRHPSLVPLSEHHHHALVQALDIRRAAEKPAEERATAFRRMAEDFLKFWEKSGRTHFREEEEFLLPAYSRHKRLDADTEVMRMLADHAAIRAAVADLAEAVRANGPLNKRLAELGAMLQEHVRLEEDSIFPRLEAVLGEGELKALGERLTPRHGKRKS
jgi:hemerythrin-like domain-containing protein